MRLFTGKELAKMDATKRFRLVKCLTNRGYETSLRVGSTYDYIENRLARNNDLITVIDETGESYIYPSSFFELIK